MDENPTETAAQPLNAGDQELAYVNQLLTERGWQVTYSHNSGAGLFLNAVRSQPETPLTTEDAKENA